MLLHGRTVFVDGDDELAAALLPHGAELVAPDGDVDVVVHVVAAELHEQSLADTSADEWMARCDAPLAAAIDAAQAAHRRLRRPGGRLIFVVPSLGQTGAAGLVALATASEGVRSLAKTAARQWGAEDINVSCVARHVAGPAVAASSLPRPTVDDVAATVALLASPHASAITGATLTVDGGTVLVP